MWIFDSDRKALTETLLGNGSGIQYTPRFSENFPTQTISGDDLYLIWDFNPQGRIVNPSVIVVAEGHLRDLLAWATTYFQSHRPFTAYFRVVEFQMLANLKSLLKPPSLEGIETACIGLVIAESMLLSFTERKPVLLTPAICSSTVSYVLARALAVGSSWEQIELIYEKWLLARKLTGQPDRKVGDVSLKDIYRIPYLLKREEERDIKADYYNVCISEVLIEACRELKRHGRIGEKTWTELADGIQELTNAHQEMESPREERVRYFQKLYNNNVLSKVEKEVNRAFICGYLASLIGPGSLSHIDLLRGYFSSLPIAILWYGLCAGLQRKNEILNSYNVLGRRLLRDLLRQEPILSPPVSDIAVSELQVLVEGNGQNLEFSTFTSNRVNIELQPCVSTYVAWPKRGERQEGQQTVLFPESEESQFRDRLLGQLGVHLRQALDIFRKIEEPRSRSFFPEKPDVKQKRKRDKKWK